ncbi:MAG: CpaE family protein [Alphaproteobacteria bacterium]
MEVTPLSTEDAAAQRDPFLAFVTDDQSERVIREIAESLLLPDDTVRRGSIEEARSFLQQVRSPSLLVVDVDQSKDPLDDIVKLADVCELGTKLIAMGTENDVTLFRDLLSMGATDYLVKPIDKENLLRSVSSMDDKGASLSSMGRLGKSVSFISSRGGAGATTLAANCGWQISQAAKRRVSMIDMDLHFGNLALILGAEATEGLADGLRQPDRIDQLFLERVMTPCGDRLFVIGGEEALTDSFQGGERHAVDTLIGELRSKFHYVLLDLPRNASDMVARSIQTSGTTVIVSDLSLAGMRDTVRLLKFIESSNAGSQIILVANKVGENPKAEIPLSDFEEGVARKVDYSIAFEPNTIMRAANLGQPLSETRSDASKVVEKLAERIAGPGPSSQNKRKSFLKSILKG